MRAVAVSMCKVGGCAVASTPQSMAANGLKHAASETVLSRSAGHAQSSYLTVTAPQAHATFTVCPVQPSFLLQTESTLDDGHTTSGTGSRPSYGTSIDGMLSGLPQLPSAAQGLLASGRPSDAVSEAPQDVTVAPTISAAKCARDHTLPIVCSCARIGAIYLVYSDVLTEQPSYEAMFENFLCTRSCNRKTVRL